MTTFANRDVDVLPTRRIEPSRADDFPQGGMIGTRGAFSTAMKVLRERNLKKIEDALLIEANLAGEDFVYGWGAGRDRIEGPSIQLALAAVRCYGNCAVEMLPVQETPDAYVFTAAYVDFETGFTLTRQFRQSKNSVVAGKHDAERKADMRFQIGQSKAIRNVVVNAMPSHLIRNAIDTAKAGVRVKLEQYIAKNGTAAAVELMLRGLAKHGVTEAMVLAKAGAAKLEGVTIDNLVMLRGDLAALDDGREFVSELFPAPEAESIGADVKKAAADIAAKREANGNAEPRSKESPTTTEAPKPVEQPSEPDPKDEINKAMATIRNAVALWHESRDLPRPSESRVTEAVIAFAKKMKFGNALDVLAVPDTRDVFVSAACLPSVDWSKYLPKE